MNLKLKCCLETNEDQNIPSVPEYCAEDGENLVVRHKIRLF